MKNKIINLMIIFVFIAAIFFSNYVLGFTKVDNLDSNLDLKLLEEENQVLKDELNKSLELASLDKYLEYDYLKSVVVLRDVYNFHNTITIKYGKDANLKKGMAVVGENGLVGLISKVNKNTSIVKLITSNDLNISVAIDENYGMLNEYDETYDYLVAESFNNYEIIMKNDEVYTSGLGLIPQGLYVGKVVNTKSINQDIEQIVNIKSEVDFNNLKYIAIIKGIKEV